MKKLLLNAFMLVMLMCVSVGAWADSYTITFGNNASGATALTSTVKASTVISDGTEYVTTSPFTVDNGNCYYGDTKTCIRLGKSGNAAGLSIALSEDGQVKATSIVINCYCTGNKNTGATITCNGSAAVEVPADDYDDVTLTLAGTKVTSLSLATTKSVYISSITVNYTATDPDEPADPIDASWSFNPESVSVTVGKTATVQVNTNYDGELIAETNNAAVATASFVGSTLTVTGVSEGTTTITFLGEGSTTYNDIEEEITVTVKAPSPFDPSDFVIEDYVDQIPAATEGNITFSLGEYTFQVKKNNGSTAPTVGTNASANNERDLRIYAKGTITISSATQYFDGIVFNLSTQGKKRLAPITADCGTVAAQAVGDATVIWSSDVPVSSVTFTVGDKGEFGSDTNSDGTPKAGQLDFLSMSITEAEAPTPDHGTLNFVAQDADGYWATFSSSHSVIFDASDVVVYTVAVDGNDIVMLEADNNSLSCVTDKSVDGGWVAGYYVQAGAGVLVYSVEESVNYYYIDTDPYNDNMLTDVETDNEYNMLRPASAPMTGDCKFYKLAYGDWTNKSGLGFYWGADGGAAFPAKEGGAYLAVPASAARAGYAFNGEEVNGLETIETSATTTIYTLDGVKVNELQKGLNIVNGKKVMVK